MTWMRRVTPVSMSAFPAPASAEFLGALDVLLLGRLVLVYDTGIARGQLEFTLCAQSGLQLPASFEFGIQFGTEQQGQVGDPEPEQEHDDAAERSVGLVV